MSAVSIYTLFSGSSGNCTYVRCGNTAILIDAGASRKAIMQALCTIGASLAEIKAIFVTHEHSDHIKGIKMLAKYDRIPIYAHLSCLSALCDVDRALIHPLSHPDMITLGDMTVRSFVTPHDSLSSCGYVIEYNGTRFGYATDMGMPTQVAVDALRGCRAVILEANYDKEMLRYGPYPVFLKDRIRGNYGHLDNDDSGKFCAFLGKTGTERILLAHLSEENNTPEKAFQAVTTILREKNVSLSLAVAGRYEPTELITLESC